MLRLFFITVLLLSPSAFADTVSVDVFFPHPFIAAPEGTGEVSVVVEDARTDPLLGKTVRGNGLLLSDNTASSLREFVADDLNQAGYVVVPAAKVGERHLLIRLAQIDYSAKKGFVKSEIDVSVTLAVEYQDGDVMRMHTFSSHMWQEVALNPSSQENGEVIGQALAAALRTMYAEPAVRSYLAGDGGE